MSPPGGSPLRTVELGAVSYEDGLKLQAKLVEERIEGRIPDTAVLLEHPPVLTKGRRSEADELGMGEDWYRSQGIEVVETDRGGRVTYHGPGQSVVYPIVDLRALGDGRRADVRAYVNALERAMIAALGEHGVPAQVFGGLTGVWTAGAPPVGIGEEGPEQTSVSACDPGLASAEGSARKIGSIGIHVTRGIASHGLAVNVTNDLQPFEWIVACGIDSARMTSVAVELARTDSETPVPSASDFSLAVAAALAAELGLQLERDGANGAG